ncbi:hypothetical protein [Curtobacterium sp. MCLR17_042]|uniref:hypothetical protein n=1 Tax=Curtobacterium sp. MCLR17_042 TaxID=2175626 RepID=UPI000DA94119|nr:hypothetical protein [Curtobacterium sp. MCLR17_042]PZE26242.1 hypothetical protein DEJ02_12285 [Curtobacterium sp. MCLR17_042]
MPGVLVECPQHGVVEAVGISLGPGVSGVTVRNSGLRCSKCGRLSKTVDGVYDVDDSGNLTIRITPAQLRRLQTAFVWAQQRAEEAETDAQAELAAEKVHRTLERQAPELAGVLDRLSSKRATAVRDWIMVVLTILTFIASTQSHTVDEATVRNIIQEVWEQSAEHDATSTTSPTPPKEELPPQRPEG